MEKNLPMSEEQGAQPDGSAEPIAHWKTTLPARAADFITKIFVITELEIRKLCHDPTELLTRAAQPALWMIVFGQVFGRVRAIPTGNLRYMDFLAPGILAQSVLFVAIFYGIAIIWERDLGLLHKLLASPTPRTALVLGKGLSAGVRALSQAAIIYALSWALRVHLSWNLLHLAGICLAVVLGAALFSTLSLIVACVVKTRERFMGIGQNPHHAAFFREQCHLSDFDHAWVAQSRCTDQPAELRGRRSARVDA